MRSGPWYGSAVLIASTAVLCFAQTSEFREPWKRADAAIMLDPFQENTIEWDKVATEPKVVAVIHRATIGSRKDTKYVERRQEAKRRGFLWGSYHLGKPGDPIKQADFYLDTVKPATNEALALDIESLNNSTDISLDNARRFIERIKEKTGRFPLVYGNDAVIRAITTRFGKDDVFSKTLLWYARFRREIPNFPKGTWDTYTLWQFSSEINCTPEKPEACLIRIPGTKADMDINVFNGSAAELKSRWPLGSSEQPANPAPAADGWRRR
jgi:Glycosyl hydrolases family 25